MRSRTAIVDEQDITDTRRLTDEDRARIMRELAKWADPFWKLPERTTWGFSRRNSKKRSKRKAAYRAKRPLHGE